MAPVVSAQTGIRSFTTFHPFLSRLGTSNLLGVLVLGRSLSSVLLRRLPLHRPLLLLIEPLEHTPALALQEHA